MLTTNLACSPWDIPANVETLKQMWTDGHSASRIAACLGVTRNAVIGKVTRLKLPRHGSNNPPKPKAPAKPNGRGNPGQANIRSILHRKEGRERAALRQSEPFRAGRLPPEDGVDVSHLIRFADRRVGKECAWIPGDPLNGAMCCGKPTVDGTEWCAEHRRRVYGGTGNFGD